MTKKLLTLLFVLVLSIMLVFAFSACGGSENPSDTSTDTGPHDATPSPDDNDETSTGELEFNLDVETNTYVVTGIGDCTDTEIVIPSTYKNLPVTSIGNYTFSSCNSLASVTIPDSVKSIGDGVFDRCTSLTSVTIPESVKSIGYGAFRYCTSLTSVTIPDSVKSIGDYAFEYCFSLTSVTIGDSVTSIGSDAFSDCASLKEVHISDIASWCNISFSSVASNPLCYGANLYIDNELVTEIVIPSTVTKINDYAFYHYTSLTSVTIPNSVTSIGDYAFKYCFSLTSVTIGDSVTSIGEESFYFCSKLVEVYNLSSLDYFRYAKIIHTSLEEESILEEVNDYIFMTWEGKYYLMGYIGNETELTLPESYNGNNYGIYEYAFHERDDMTKIIIPDSVTSIGFYAFEYCTSLEEVHISNIASWCNISFYDYYSNPLYCAKNLYINNELVTNLTIPDTVTKINAYAFHDCTSLTSVTIPNSVTSIGESAFYDCTSLTSVTIPNSVTSIGSYAFSDCTSLTSVTFESTSGWYVTLTQGATSGTNVDVTNATTNAANLTDKCGGYYWYRNIVE